MNKITIDLDDPRVLELLADLEHKQWMKWAESMVKTENLSQKRKDRWVTMFSPYEDLPEKIKDYDREWARKIIAVLETCDCLR
jgi:hypothetical protein